MAGHVSSSERLQCSHGLREGCQNLFPEEEEPQAGVLGGDGWRDPKGDQTGEGWRFYSPKSNLGFEFNLLFLGE